MHDRTGKIIDQDGKEVKPEAFIVEPAKMTGNSYARWERLMERLKERDYLAIRPMQQVKIERVPDEPQAAPAAPVGAPAATPAPAPRPPVQIPTLEELNALTDKMAEYAHVKWMEIRGTEKGWHNPKDCPEPNGCVKCHPCMVPYEQLPKDDKAIDRAYPVAFLNILKDQGYGLVKLSDM